MIADRKYQIFVSSTYEDLQAERGEVIRAVLEMGHIPVGMEMFSAADEQQWKIIQRTIDTSDYYIVLLARRYGSLAGDISYTEKEYDYAVSRGIPVLGFLLQDDANWPVNRVDKDAEAIRQLDTFREKLRLKPIGTFRTKEDLHGALAIALMKAFTAQPRVGWVRSDQYSGPEVTAELTRLSRENGQLREQLEAANAIAASRTSARHKELVNLLHKSKRPISVWKSSEWEPMGEQSLLELFRALAPQLSTEVPETLAAATIALLASNSIEFRANWPVPRNTVQPILADLQAMGLVEPSQRRHAVSDKESYWTLSPAGTEFHSYLRRWSIENAARDTVKDQGPLPAAEEGK